MHKKRAINISLSAILAISLIGFMFWSSETCQGHGFTRVFPPHFLAHQKSIDVETSTYTIIGVSSREIYLGSPNDPEHFLALNPISGKTEKHRLYIPDNQKIAWGALHMQIDSTGIYIMEGITPTILYSHRNSLNLVRQVIDSIHFNQILPISSSSYILNTYDPLSEQNILVKETLNPIHIKQMQQLLEKQVDGVFCTDGELLFNKENRLLIYIYRYRNSFLLMDTDLHLIRRGKTIDTVSRAQIKVTTIEKKGKKQYMLASPPLVVNKKSDTFGNLLFVHSNLRSQNEDRDHFSQNSVIDIYTLPDLRYLYSFYIPSYQGKRMNDFAVHHNTLMALYDNHLLVFEMGL